MAKPTQVSFSRRDFLKGALLAGVTTASSGLLTGCGAQSAQGVEWDDEADIVIVGGGGAGLASAIEAKETADVSVIVLEKSPAVGGSTALSGGVVQASGTRYQKEAGVEGDTPEKHYQYWMQSAEGIANPDLVRILAEKAPEGLSWLEEHGLTYVSVYGVSPIPTVDDELMVARIHVPGGRGETAAPGTGAVHMEALNNSAKALGVDIRTETPVVALITEEGKGVVGVRASVNEADTFIKAKKAVILAAGGIDHNADMAREVTPQQLWELNSGVCFCCPQNTGDGIKMAMALGADLAGLSGTIGVPGVTMGTDALNEALEPIPGIWVNKYGQRFVNEGGHYAYVMRAVYQQEDQEAWAIFDENVKALGGTMLGGLWGGWSEDLSEEIASGRVIKGESLEELAAAIGVNAPHLARTLDGWNADAAEGVDTLFGKEVGIQPLDTAPYYATKVTSVNLGSCGGIKINTNAQVVDVNGQVVPHLYAAGMTAGGFIGPYYPGSGTAVMSTVVFGRIAGANAAAEEALA